MTFVRTPAWKRPSWLLAALAAVVVSYAQPASAAPFRLLLESRADAPGGSEVYVASFNSLSDVLSATPSSGAFSVINIVGSFAATGLAYDGDYRLLLESRLDAPGGSEVFQVTFVTLSDLLSGSVSSSGFSTMDIAPGYTVAGLTYDGKYRLMLESRADAPGGTEIFLATFDTLADMMSGHASSSGFSTIDIVSSYLVAGLAFDGKYRMLLESRSDAPGGSEVALATFDTFGDLMSAHTSSFGFSAINISPSFKVAGFEAEYRPIPEPASLALLVTGLAGMSLKRRRR